MTKRIAIITGASSGLGREFAIQLSAAYELDEMILLAHEKELKGLEETASMISVPAVLVPLDLTASGSMDRIRDMLRDRAPRISILVNNAGFAHLGTFTEAPLDRLLTMIDLNVKALVELTHICIPLMDAGSFIYQVASISAFLPGPNLAVYAASKSFVLSFAHALYRELEGRGIHVISVSPGPVATGFWQTASSGAMAPPQNASRPADVVARALKDAGKKRINSTYGFAAQLTIALSRILNRKFHLRLLQ
ncbi:MAG: short-chain dehydrogenase [Spirochaetae bacterium HGW-Spirochaetae-1]|jgi:hypothetical protein|nr:MAG: short-chain dehydrogenase [Spirochaetae bacterium HGW-Spirochaetae-1]